VRVMLTSILSSRGKAWCVWEIKNEDDFIIEQEMTIHKWWRKFCDNDSRSQRK
jgi:hypothetical protein